MEWNPIHANNAHYAINHITLPQTEQIRTIPKHNPPNS